MASSLNKMKKILRLYNGSIQIFESNENKISEIAFETYDLNLTQYNKQESSHIYSDELYTNQIISNLDGKKLTNLINMKGNNLPSYILE